MTIAPKKMDRRTSVVRRVWLLIRLGSWVLVITAVAPLFPVNWWWVRLGDFPRMQLLTIYLVAIVVILFFVKRFRILPYLALMFFCCAIQLYWILPYLPFMPVEVEIAKTHDTSNRLSVVTVNVLQENRQSDRLLDLIQKIKPNLLVLLEVDDWWMNQLGPLEKQFSYRIQRPQDNTYGIAFFTNLSVASGVVRNLVEPEIPSIDASIQLPNGQSVRVFVVHPNPPRVGESTTDRDAELVVVGKEIGQCQCSAIVLGDLNDVGWSRTTNLFKELSGTLDPRVGRGMYPTFDATSRIWRYPLDHIFHTDDFRLVKLKTLPDINSDHFPLFVEIAHEPDAQATQQPPELDASDLEDAEESLEKERKED